MKRNIGIFLVMVAFLPIVVKANIVCNDGTVSPGCSTCHQGCCSRHGGCSSSSSGGSSSSSGSSNKKPTVVEKAKSSDNTLKKVTIDGDSISIANNMVYTTTKESVTILAVANDTKASVNYEKNPNLSLGENTINIKVTAENRSVKNYKLIITREKILSDNKNLKIFVDGIEVKFNLFKSDVINIANDKDKIDITYELEDLNAKAEIIGNENLKEGYNEIVVKATSENGDEQDYTLIVKKEEKVEENKEENEEEKIDVPKEITDNQINDEDENDIFSALGSLTILGGVGYLIYTKVKKK